MTTGYKAYKHTLTELFVHTQMHVHKCTEDLVQRRLPQRAHDHGGLFAVSSGLLRLRGVVVPIGRGVGESVVPAVGVVRSSRCYRSARPSPSALISPVHSHASPKKVPLSYPPL